MFMLLKRQDIIAQKIAQMYLSGLKKLRTPYKLLKLLLAELHTLIPAEERYLLSSFEKGHGREEDRFSYQKTFVNFDIEEGEKVLDVGSGAYPLSMTPAWHALVNIYLDAASEIDYRLAPEKSGAEVSFDAADPMLYLSDDTAFQGYSFRNYVSQVDASPNDYFDVVLIDGRARPACIRHSVPKIKVKGLLILDNADRAYYTAKTHVYLQNFCCYSFYGAGKGNQMWGTNIYVRQK